MRKRSVSLLLVLTLIVAAGTLVQDFRFDSSISEERARARAAEREFSAVSRDLAALRAAQAGYVAAGQGPDFWMTRATDLAGGISASIARLREFAFPSTAPRFAAADAALAAFNKVDARIRDFVRSDQRLFASDLIFVDSLQQIDKVDAELAAALAVESAESDQRVAQLARLRLAMNAAAMLGLLVLVLVMRPAAVVVKTEPKPAPSTLQMLRDLPPPVKNPLPAAPPPPPPLPVVPQTTLKPASLSAAAELCVDLARVMDARDMPALVQRAATVLEAKGVVLWVADVKGLTLRPSMTHGYSEKVLARLGPLQIDGDNVTALAYRSMQPQTVSGTSPADAGALAVPLITSSGCVGVLAAETRANRSTQDLLPLARIIAAQLASVVSPIEISEPRTAQA